MVGQGHKDAAATLAHVIDNGGGVDAPGAPAPRGNHGMHPCMLETSRAGFPLALLLLVVTLMLAWSMTVKVNVVFAVTHVTQPATQSAAQHTPLPAT